MPFSTHIFKEQTKNYINNFFHRNWNIIDIGAGCGTYSDMLKPMGFFNVDAIEIYEPYISTYSLKNKYENVYCDNIITTNIDFLKYEAAILGDVLEHISIKDARIVLEKLDSVKEVIIGVPFNAQQGEYYGNIYETHLQDKLTNQDFLNLYREYDIFCLRYDYGIYIKNNNKLKELYTLDTTDQDNEFLKRYYEHREIINLNETKS
jgi:hypothetical protein